MVGVMEEFELEVGLLGSGERMGEPRLEEGGVFVSRAADKYRYWVVVVAVAGRASAVNGLMVVLVEATDAVDGRGVLGGWGGRRSDGGGGGREGGGIASKAQEAAGVDVGAAWVEEEEVVQELVFFVGSKDGIDGADLGDVGKSRSMLKALGVSVGAHAVVELVGGAAAEFPGRPPERRRW